jgi:replication-associated recombination protein RarA
MSECENKKIEITVQQNKKQFLINGRSFKSIIIIGPRSSGKSSVGRVIGESSEIQILKLDEELDRLLKEYDGLEKVTNDENWSLIEVNIKDKVYCYLNSFNSLFSIL